LDDLVTGWEVTMLGEIGLEARDKFLTRDISRAAPAPTWLFALAAAAAAQWRW
jgi:hypothetical protein